MKLKKGRYRYNGFCKNWKLVKLGNIVEINPKSFLPRTFKYVDLESVVGTELISYREEFRESAPSRAQRVAQKGDVFYQTVRPYQKNNYLFDLNENDYVFSTGYAQLRPKVDSAFLLARLQEEGFVNKVIERCSGTSFPAINSKDLSRISITIPEDFDEQSAIGSFFRNLDDLLASYKDNLVNYQSLKVTMLSKMFPKAGQTVPEIRLDGFEDEWVEKRLKDISKRVTRKNSDLVSERALTISAQFGLIDQEEFFQKKIASKDVSGYYLIKKGEFAYNKSYSTGYPLGAIKRLDKYENGVLSTLYILFKAVDVDSDYLAHYYESDKWHREVSMCAAEGARNHGLLNIAPADFFNTRLVMPKELEEQQAIGSYFSNLDNLINSHQEKISQLETLKKKLLQEMFI